MKDYSADRFIHLEDGLNDIRFKGVPIGGLFANELFNLYSNKENSFSWSQVLSVAKLFFTSYFNYRSAQNKITFYAPIFISKVANREHLNKLIDPIADYFHKTSVLVSGEKEYQFNNISYKNISALNLKNTLYVFLYCIKNIFNVKKKFREYHVSINLLSLFLIFFSQVLKLQTWLNIFDETKPKLVLLDCDRYQYSCPMVLAANIMGVNSITLVHGVISSPYGYNPVLADEIWCWGDFQKKILIDLGVPP